MYVCSHSEARSECGVNEAINSQEYANKQKTVFSKRAAVIKYLCGLQAPNEVEMRFLF